MKPNQLPSQEYLRECFDYHPSTGRLTWRKRPRSHFPSDRACNAWNGVYPDTMAGRINTTGHREIGLCKTRTRAARIIYKWMTGRDPISLIDHENGDRADDRWHNLREATPKQNAANCAIKKKWGHKGVAITRYGRFEARIWRHPKLIYLGTFHTAEAAHAAYIAAAREQWGEFANGG